MEPITVFVLCVDQESGKYVAFTQEAPASPGTGYTEESAVVDLLESSRAILVKRIEHGEKPRNTVAAPEPLLLQKQSPTTGLTFEQATFFARATPGTKIQRACSDAAYLTCKPEWMPHWAIHMKGSDGKFMAPAKWPDQAPRYHDATREHLMATDWMVIP